MVRAKRVPGGKDAMFPVIQERFYQEMNRFCPVQVIDQVDVRECFDIQQPCSKFRKHLYPSFGV